MAQGGNAARGILKGQWDDILTTIDHTGVTGDTGAIHRWRYSKRMTEKTFIDLPQITSIRDGLGVTPCLDMLVHGSGSLNAKKTQG